MVPSADLLRLAGEAFASGDFARAIQYYDAMAAYGRFKDMMVYAELHYGRSMAHAALGLWPQALADATRAVQLRPIWMLAVLARCNK
jgi:tetratricopeptide (TPR) repeat protein